MTERIVAYDDHQEHWYTGEVIVRCRDCVYRASDSLGEYCTLFDFGDADSERQLNGYCAWGERREAVEPGERLQPPDEWILGFGKEKA